MESMFQQAVDAQKQAANPNQPSPAATPAASPAPSSPSPEQGGGDMQGMFQQAVDAQKKTPPPPPPPAASNKQGQGDNTGIAKHGFLSRAYDWVMSKPILDNVLPDNAKTADLFRAAAFEKLYGEAYMPGINDFDTKGKEVESKFKENQGPNNATNKTNLSATEAHREWVKSFIQHAVAGSAKDASDMAAGFTSPFGLGTLGLGPLSKTAGATGTLAKVASPLIGTAFGLQGAYHAAHGTYDMIKHGITPENVQEATSGGSQALLGATAVAHPVEGLVQDVRDASVPQTKTVGGQDVPVRAEGFKARMAQQSVPDEVNQAATRQTEAAVQRGVGNVIGNAVGSESPTEVHTQDRLGIRNHSADLRAKATPAMDALDRMSDNAYSEAQQMVDESRQDFTREGREQYNTSKALRDSIVEDHRQAMDDAGYNVDDMKSNYRKSIALDKIADRFEKATGPLAGSPGDYRVNGKALAKAIDSMAKVPGNESPSLSKNQFERAGLEPSHIQALTELADTLREQQETPKFGGLAKFAAKALSVAALGHGVGIGGALTGLAGEGIAENLGSKAMGKLFGEALTSEPIAKELKGALSDPAKLGAMDSFKKIVADLYDKYKASPAGSQKGAVGRDINQPTKRLGGKKGALAPINPEPMNDMKVSKAENGDWKFNHPNGESEMTLHPEPDTREGFEGKTQLRQTGISAVDHPGAGQEMMDDAVARMNKADNLSRIISDHPDRRSPDNEGHWSKLSRRGHDVNVEESKDSYGQPWEDWVDPAAKTPLNGGESGKAYYIPKEEAAPEARLSTTQGDNPESEISTRSITSGSQDKGTFNRTPNNPQDSTGWAAIEAGEKAKPGFMKDMLDKVLSYKDNGIKLTDEQKADPRKGLKAVVDHFADNLTFLHDNMPADHRAIAKQWYDSANKMATDIATQHGTTPEKVAATIAALSPQNPWDVNVGQAERIVKMYQTMRDHPWTPEMDTKITARIASALDGKNPQVEYAKNMKSIRGKNWNELTVKGDPDATRYNQALWMRTLDEAHGNPQTPVYAPDGKVRSYQKFNWGLIDPMAKSLDIMEGDGSPESIHQIIGDGHKIRNFYNNIISPNSTEGHATIDTHLVNADMLKPMASKNDIEVTDNFGGAPGNKATGQKGTYSLHHAALRQAADARGILPREMQSITWEAVKTLMGDEKKTPELRKAVTDIWQKYQAGDLTVQDARAKIVKAAGGFDEPQWSKERNQNGALSNVGSDEGEQRTDDAKELPVLGLRGQPAIPAGRGSGSVVPASVPATGRADLEAIGKQGKVKAKPASSSTRSMSRVR